MTRKRTTENDVVVSTGAAAAAPRRKASARTRAKHTNAPAETLAAAAPQTDDVVAETPIAAPALTAVSTAYQPSHEEIAAEAYLYWEARGFQGGSPEEDWLRAEQELRSRAALIA